MQFVKTLFKAQWIRIIYSIVVVGLASITGLLFVSGAIADENTMEKGDTYIFLFVGLLLCALFINIALDEDADDLKWRIRFQNWIRIALIFIWGFAGIMWYLYPDKNRLEPATFLLTAAIAFFSYQVERNQKKLDHISISKTQ